MEAEYIDDCICISKYSLSAGYCLNKITNCFEDLWEVK
jgi:rRNA small subunit pseudouridine methyltransferase Nep1